MSKKHDSRSTPAEQHRQDGAAAGDPDAQAGHQGKVENDHNKVGHQAPTQKNEGRRTPESRHDREAQLGSHNQSQTRQNPAHGGEGGASTVGRSK